MKKKNFKSNILIFSPYYSSKVFTYPIKNNLYPLKMFIEQPDFVGLPKFNVKGLVLDNNQNPLKEVEIYFDNIKGYAETDLNGFFHFYRNQIDRLSKTEAWFYKQGYKIIRKEINNLVSENYNIDLGTINLERIDNISSQINLTFLDYNKLPATGIQVNIKGVNIDTLDSNGKINFKINYSKPTLLKVDYETIKKENQKNIKPDSFFISLRSGNIDSTIIIPRKYLLNITVLDSILNIPLKDVNIIYESNLRQIIKYTDKNGFALIDELIPPSKLIFKKGGYKIDTLYLSGIIQNYTRSFYMNGLHEIKLYVKNIFDGTLIKNALIKIKVLRNKHILSNFLYDSTNSFGFVCVEVHIEDTLLVDIKHKDYFNCLNQKINENDTIFLCPKKMNTSIASLYISNLNKKIKISSLSELIDTSNLKKNTGLIKIKVFRNLLTESEYNLNLKLLWSKQIFIPSVSFQYWQFLTDRFDAEQSATNNWGYWFGFDLQGIFDLVRKDQNKNNKDIAYRLQPGIGLHLNLNNSFLNKLFSNRAFRFSPGFVVNYITNNLNNAEYLNDYSFYFSLYSYPHILTDNFLDNISFQFEYEYMFNPTVSSGIYDINKYYKMPKYELHFSLGYDIPVWSFRAGWFLFQKDFVINSTKSGSVWGLELGTIINLKL